jgi:hypothetical protein
MKARGLSLFLARVETPKPRCPGASARLPVGKRHMLDVVVVPSINVKLCFISKTRFFGVEKLSLINAFYDDVLKKFPFTEKKVLRPDRTCK